MKPYLDAQKPVFFYVVQGEIKFQRKDETYEQGPGAQIPCCHKESLNRPRQPRSAAA